MLPVVILPAARLDLLEQAEYYDSEGGDDLGNRLSTIAKMVLPGWPSFLKAVRASGSSIPS